MPLLDMYVAYT